MNDFRKDELSRPNRTINDFPRNGVYWEATSPRKSTSDAVNTKAEYIKDVDSSTYLRKRAIDAIAVEYPSAANQELAHDLGYGSVREMMEQTEVVPLRGGSFMYLTTDSDCYWVAWREKPFHDIQRFDSRQQAITCLQERTECMTTESQVY